MEAKNVARVSRTDANSAPCARVCKLAEMTKSRGYSGYLQTFLVFFVLGFLLNENAMAMPVGASCDPAILDICGSELVIFGTGPRIPETSKELLKQCAVERKAEMCAREFAKQCLPPLPRGMVIVVLEGISEEVSSKCNVSNPLHQAFLKHAPCLNKVGERLHRCMTKLTTKLDMSASMEPHLRVGRSCCNFAEYIQCSSEVAEERCGVEAGEYTRKLLTRAAGDFIEIACVHHRPGESARCADAYKETLSATGPTNRIGFNEDYDYDENDFGNRTTSLLSPLAKLVTAEG